jgi:tetratricopeptide (TPR) repeat protein
MTTYTFVYTAANPDGKNVTERIEAENIGQAKYRLEIRGFSEITFHANELRDEILQTFEVKENPLNKVSAEIENKIKTHNLAESILFAFKTWAIIWIPLLAWLVYDISNAKSYWLSLTFFGAFILYFVFLNLPSVFYKMLIDAYEWARWDEVRYWVKIINWYNKISPLAVPAYELDSRLACADAAEGDLENGLRRMKKYENHPKVSRFLYYAKLAIIYEKAKRHDKKLEYQELTVREYPDRTDGYIDYAFTLARDFRDTSKAREVLETISEKEITFMALPFVSFCQGIIEFEDGNLQKAEFDLLRALEKAKPFERAMLFTGVMSELKAYLSLLYGKIGEKDKALDFLQEAKPYLLANKEDELLERCEKALA